jgi:4-amino-4-deoxy-L-arabinose transferase-like glycosyltransferase
MYAKNVGHRLSLLLVLLLAAALRLIGLNNVSPPGLAHDEVAHWLINRDILAGNHAIYFTEAYGHEAGFHYVQAGFALLVGDNALALRLPAAFAGLLLVAVSYALVRRMFGRSVALTAAALLAVLFWPVFYSRQALRAISLPLLSGLSAYFWQRAWQGEGARGREGEGAMGRWGDGASGLGYFALAGLLAGLSIHTYMAARALPIFYALYGVYLALWRRAALRRRWRGVLLFIVLFAGVAAPLVIYLQRNPGAEFRVAEVDAPLRALRAGDLRPVWENGLKIAGAFGLEGDPLWRQNVAGAPVFDPLLAALFYAGALWCAWRFLRAPARHGRYAFVLLWLAASTIPSLVTIDAPSTIRMINMLPLLTLFPALLIHKIPRLSTVFPNLSTKQPYVLASLFVLYHIWRTAVFTFHTWPANAEVQFVWQTALTETAVYLDSSPAAGPVAVGGWSPETMDAPTMALSLRRDDLSLRYFGSDATAVPIQSVIVPAAAASAPARVTHPAIRTLAPALAAQLAAWSGGAQPIDSFVLYELVYPPPIAPQVALNAEFAGQLRLLGYDAAPGAHAAELNFVTFWEVTAVPDGPRRFFLHALDGNGDIVAQHDNLDAPAMHWRPGDVLLQFHTLPLETAVGLALRLGVYNPETGVRLALENGRDFVELSAR